MFEQTLGNLDKIRDVVKQQPFHFFQKHVESSQCFQKYDWSSVGLLRLLETNLSQKISPQNV